MRSLFHNGPTYLTGAVFFSYASILKKVTILGQPPGEKYRGKSYKNDLEKTNNISLTTTKAYKGNCINRKGLFFIDTQVYMPKIDTIA